MAKIARSAADIQAVLHQRAETLAKEVEAEQTASTHPYILFTLGPEKYGIEAQYVVRVCVTETVVPVPNTPAFINGIMNSHGEIVCVVDLKTILGFTRKSKHTTKPKIIVVEDAGIQFGIVVDKLLGAEAIDTTTLQTSVAPLTNHAAEFIAGITPTHWILLNAKKLIHSPALIVNAIE